MNMWMRGGESTVRRGEDDGNVGGKCRKYVKYQKQRGEIHKKGKWMSLWMIFEVFKTHVNETQTQPGPPDRPLPWSCGSARCPNQIQRCEAPWKRRTGTRPGPRFRSCTKSRCSPSRGRAAHVCTERNTKERGTETA